MAQTDQPSIPISRRAAVRTAGLVGALAGALGGVIGRPAVTRAAPGQEIVGVWLGDTSRVGGLLLTFSADGTYIGSSSQHRTHTAFHGVWVRTGDRSVLATSLVLLLNEAGQPAGMAKSRVEFVVDANDRTMTARGIREDFGVDGQLLLSFPITGEYKRLMPEPFE